LIVATMMTTLFLTPFMVGLGPQVACVIGRRSSLSSRIAEPASGSSRVNEGRRDHIVIVGFGPAGQRVAELMMAEGRHDILVVELTRRSADLARRYGFRTFAEDATHDGVLARLNVRTAAGVVITIPDPWTARHVIQQVRALAPNTPIVVRARYHIHHSLLEVAGADAVVDEEEEVGIQIAAELSRRLIDGSG